MPSRLRNKHSVGNDTSGSRSHNSESSGEENGNGDEKRGAGAAYYAKTKVQLRTGNEHREWLRGNLKKQSIEVDWNLVSQGLKDACWR